MALDPGPTPASRIHGTIHDYPPKPRGASVPAIFNTMTEEKATWFYDAKKPCGYWHGVVGRRDGRLVLAQMERSEEHTSELQSLAYLVCRLLLEKKKKSKRQLRIIASRTTLDYVPAHVTT